MIKKLFLFILFVLLRLFTSVFTYPNRKWAYTSGSTISIGRFFLVFLYLVQCSIIQSAIASLSGVSH